MMTYSTVSVCGNISLWQFGEAQNLNNSYTMNRLICISITNMTLSWNNLTFKGGVAD